MHEQQPLLRASCAACHAPLRLNARFCAECGQTASGPVQPPSQGVPQERPSLRVQFAAHMGELRRVGWLFGLLLLSSFVLGMAVKIGGSSPWHDVVGSGATAVITLAFVASMWSGTAPLLGLPRVAGTRDVWILLGGSFAAVVVLQRYFALLETMAVPMVDYTKDFADAGWPVWTMFAMTCALPAVFEELAFRGVIQSSLERVFSQSEAWLIQAALFSVLHLLPLIFPSHFVLGLWFGWLRRRTGSLYPGMIAHFLWNAAVVAEELWGKSAL